MMALLLVLGGLLAPAWAGHHVVREGETLESIAEAALGSAARAEELRSLNQLSQGASLVPGTVLELPPEPGEDREGLGAYVTALQGRGTVTLDGGRELPLALGMSLRDGAVVCTNADSFARLRLVREAESVAHDDISLLSGTCLVVESTAAHASGRAALVRLEVGEISVLGSDDQRGEVTVRSEDGVTTGEQGGFRVAREATATRIEAIAGAVAVISGGQEVEVDMGFGSRARAGQAPDVPTPLYGAVQLQRPAEGALLLRPSFAWSPATDFLGYRLEISTTPDFSGVVMVQELTADTWAPELLFLPVRDLDSLWWRVSVFDRIGLLGMPSVPRRLTLPEQLSP